MEGGEGLGFFDYSTDGLVSGDWAGSREWGTQRKFFFSERRRFFVTKFNFTDNTTNG